MRTIELTQGFEAVVDDEDYELLSQFTWHIVRTKQGKIYAKRYIRGSKNKYIAMHKDIIGDTTKLDIDHINGDGLDNRRSNLRPATRAQNLGNMRKHRGVSKYKGVCWDKRQERWYAYIRVIDKRKYLGRYTIEEDAARSYDIAAEEHFGEFARLNFPIDKT